jgi:hypothetical protein
LNPLARALEREEAAAAHNRGVDLFVPIPAIHAPVRVKNSAKQFVQSGVSITVRFSVPFKPACFNAVVSIGSFRRRLPVAAKDRVW